MMGKMRILGRRIACAFLKTGATLSARKKRPGNQRPEITAWNRAHDIRGKMINDQNTGETTGVNRLRLGKSPMELVGCEVIAVHNARCLMGMESSVAETSEAFEKCRSLIRLPGFCAGRLGANPYSIPLVLQHLGISCRTAEPDGLYEPGIYILSRWNRGGVLRGLHTMAVFCAGSGEVTVYNYNGRGSPLILSEAGELLRRTEGQIITIWRLEKPEMNNV